MKNRNRNKQKETPQPTENLSQENQEVKKTEVNNTPVVEESTSQIFNLTDKTEAAKEGQPKKVQTRNPVKAWGQK